VFFRSDQPIDVARNNSSFYGELPSWMLAMNSAIKKFPQMLIQPG